MSSTNKSLIERELQLHKREAALNRRIAIEPELQRFVDERKINQTDKLGFSALFAEIPDRLEVCFTEADGDLVKQSGAEFLTEFLEDLTPAARVEPKNYELLKQIIDETYTDRIDKITEALVYPSGKIEVFAIDEGRRLSIEIGENISISQDWEDANFSSSFTGAKPKPRNCKTGISCGATCISKSKACKKKASQSQATKTKEVLALTHVPKKAQSQSKRLPRVLSEREKIDAKYAGGDLSDSQVNSWIKERMAHDFKPTDENAVRLVIASDSNMPYKYRDTVHDKASYVKMKNQVSPQAGSAEDVGMMFDIQVRMQKAGLQSYAEADAATGKTAAQQKKVDKAKSVADASRERDFYNATLLDLPPQERSGIGNLKDLAKKYLSQSGNTSGALYEKFGLNSGASVADIKKRYRELASKAHPDAGGSAEEFRRVTDAYERLLRIENANKSAKFSTFSIPSLKNLLSELDAEIKAESKNRASSTTWRVYDN